MFTAMAIQFASLTLTVYSNDPSFSGLHLETKILPLMSQMLAFLGTLYILTIKIFLSFASNFPFQVLMEENYEKCCN